METRAVGGDGSLQEDSACVIDHAGSAMHGKLKKGETWSCQCRYKGRGLFLNSPYVGIIKGQWRIKGDTSSDAKGWPSLEALIKDGESRAATAQEYEDQIASAIDE